MKSHSDLDAMIRPIRRRMWFVVALIVAWGLGWFVVHSIVKERYDAAAHAR